MVPAGSAASSTGIFRESTKTTPQRSSPRWPPASPGAPPGSSEGSASGRRFFLLLRDVRLIRRRVHQRGNLRRIRQLDFDQPPRRVRIGINRFRLLHQRAMLFRHIAAVRRINFANRLHRFHRPKRLPGRQLSAHFRQLHKHHIAQLVLRVIRNPHRSHIALYINPLMILRIFELRRISHRFTPSSAYLHPNKSRLCRGGACPALLGHSCLCSGHLQVAPPIPLRELCVLPSVFSVLKNRVPLTLTVAQPFLAVLFGFSPSYKTV